MFDVPMGAKSAEDELKKQGMGCFMFANKGLVAVAKGASIEERSDV